MEEDASSYTGKNDLQKDLGLQLYVETQKGPRVSPPPPPLLHGNEPTTYINNQSPLKLKRILWASMHHAYKLLYGDAYFLPRKYFQWMQRT